MSNRNFNDQVDPAAEEAPKASPQRTSMKSFRPGELMKLDKVTIRALTKLCREGVDAWLEGADVRLNNLRRWNDLLEGVTEEVDTPWDGASNLNIPLIALHLVTLGSVMSRSVLDVDPLWTGKTLDTSVRDMIPDIEEFLTYKSKSELNVVEGIRDVLYTTPRDGLGWLQATWVHQTRPIETVLRVTNVAEFQKEFPTPEDAQLSPEEYSKVLLDIQQNATAESPYEIPYEDEVIEYSGPRVDLVDEADMVRAPYTAKSLRDCRVYGKRFYPRLEELQSRATDGDLWEEAVKTYSSKRSKTRTDSSSDDSWRSSRNTIEGISDSDTFSDECEGFELVVRYKDPESKKEALILCTYTRDKDILLGAVKYPYTCDCYIPFRIIRRAGRMTGVSVPERLEGMNEEINDSIRFESNCDKIELSPIFKGKKDQNKDFDPSLEENQVEPGVTWWMTEPKDFDQLKISPGNKNFSVERRQELMRYAEMLIGPTQLLSGKESPTDPSAPAKKTLALIAQSNMRIEDYIREFKYGFDKLGDVILAMYDQFGDLQLPFETREGDVKSLDRGSISPQKRPKLAMRGLTAIMNPDQEFERAQQWYGMLSPIPEIRQDPVKFRTLLSDLLVAGRHPNREAILPAKAEAQQALEEQYMNAAREKVMQELQQKGIIPPPPAPPKPIPVTVAQPEAPAPGGPTNAPA